jgi:hypothetical protein
MIAWLNNNNSSKTAPSKEPQQIVMQQDPGHTEALSKLSQALAAMPQAQGAAFDKNANAQKQAMTELVHIIVQSQNEMGAKLSDGLVQVGQMLAQGLAQATQAMAGSAHQTAEAVGAIRDVVGELGDNYGDHASAMTGAIDKLHKTISSPRVRELRKDARGNKSAIDRLARDDEV